MRSQIVLIEMKSEQTPSLRCHISNLRFAVCRIKFHLILALFLPVTVFAARPDLSKEINKQLKKYFIQNLDLPDTDVFVESARMMKPANELPEWDKIQVIPGKRPAKKGLQIVNCRLYLQGKPRAEVEVKVRVKTFQDVVVSKNLFSRHQVIGRNEIKLSRIETTRLTRKYYTRIEDVVGLRTKKVLRAGELITGQKVQPVPVITRGSRIEIHFAKGGVRIILPGVARQDGGLGEIIIVKCTENYKTFRGKVVNAEAVVVDF